MPIGPTVRKNIPLHATCTRWPDHLDQGRCVPGRQARKSARRHQLRAAVTNFKAALQRYHPRSARIHHLQQSHAAGSEEPAAA